MPYLLDTHLLIWSLYRPELLPPAARVLLSPPATEISFSVVSLIEIAIKQNLGKLPFAVDLVEARDELLHNRYTELQIKAPHAVALNSLHRIHKDPFDRLLVAQAVAERLVLLTVDSKLSEYGDMVLVVR